jgi:hypothetical protein
MKAADSQQTMSCELQPENRQVRLVYRRSNFAGNRHFSPLLGTLGAPSRWQSSLGISLQQHEIGPEACPPGRPRYPVAGVPEYRDIEFRLCFTSFAQSSLPRSSCRARVRHPHSACQRFSTPTTPRDNDCLTSEEHADVRGEWCSGAGLRVRTPGNSGNVDATPSIP